MLVSSYIWIGYILAIESFMHFLGYRYEYVRCLQALELTMVADIYKGTMKINVQRMEIYGKRNKIIYRILCV